MQTTSVGVSPTWAGVGIPESGFRIQDSGFRGVHSERVKPGVGIQPCIGELCSPTLCRRVHFLQRGDPPDVIQLGDSSDVILSEAKDLTPGKGRTTPEPRSFAALRMAFGDESRDSGFRIPDSVACTPSASSRA
jgi:hypothetical protein